MIFSPFILFALSDPCESPYRVWRAQTNICKTPRPSIISDIYASFLFSYKSQVSHIDSQRGSGDERIE